MKFLHVVMLMVCVTAQAWAGPADPVIAAERAFAADGAARGWVAAFKRYSADDAVLFQPDVVRAKESLAKQSETPAETSLKWWPAWAGIAASGDLGFTTGPYARGEQRLGHYFTVWALQPDGAWRWIYDGGPRNDASATMGPDGVPEEVPLPAAVTAPNAGAWDEVAAIEKAMTRRALQDARGAYLLHLAPDARLMGSAAAPATDAATRAAELQQRAATIAFTPLGGRASRAGDLVFTYGKAQWMDGGEARQGHTVRIWQKRGDAWALIFDELLTQRPS